MSSVQERLEFAVQTARQAGELALRYFNDLASIKVQRKGVQDVASEADIAVEQLIRARTSAIVSPGVPTKSESTVPELNSPIAAAPAYAASNAS